MPAVLAEALGQRWEAASLRFKPYPSNYYTHAGIDAALALSRYLPSWFGASRRSNAAILPARSKRALWRVKRRNSEAAKASSHASSEVNC